MSQELRTVRVKATHPPSQGEWVVMNESDFDPARHELYDAQESEQPKRRGRPPKLKE